MPNFCWIMAVSLLAATACGLRPAPAQLLSRSILNAAKVPLSPMVENMAVSKTIEIHSLTKEMERAGKTVFSLCVGEPDYQPPSVVLKATADAAQAGLTKYTAVNGDAELRSVIASDLKTRKNTAYTAEQIVVSNGAKQSVLQALLTVVSPGDDVLVPSPYWPSYPDMVKMCNARPVDVVTSPQNGYALTGDSLRKTLEKHPQTSALILCNPSNPTGCVMTGAQLQELAEVLVDFPKVTVIADEIYERLTYDVPHVSFASLSCRGEKMIERTVTINGFSKSHSMTGYRVGYAAAPLYIAKACGKLQSQMTSCASSIGQYAATVALKDVGDDWMAARVDELRSKRDLACGLLKRIPNTKTPLPTGAFYIMPDVSYYYGTVTSDGRPVRDSHEMCLELLRCEQVALVSGDAFGAPDCIRLSYAASTELITESITRLDRFLASLKKK